MALKLKYLGFLFFILGNLTAQNINIGALAGVNASQVSGDGYGGFNKAGLLIGVYSNFDISQKVNLQFEINYSQKGSRRNPKTDKGNTDFFLLRMNYVEIPVIARVQKNSFTFEGGFYYSQLVYDYLENENGPFDIPEEFNQFNDFDTGFLIGVNFNFTESLIMNWRYSNSIVHFREYDSEAEFQFDSGMFHNYLSFTLRYEFIGNGS